MSRISVIIPLYNHDIFIKDAIDSILNQSIDIFEIIIVNDGSSDNSGNIARDIANKSSKISYYEQKNSGAHNAINRGISLASGEYIAILNSDDIYHHDRMEKLLEKTIKNKVDVTFSWIDFIDDKSRKIKNEWYSDAIQFYIESNNFPLSLINGNFLMTTSNLFCKREVFDKVAYFSNLRYAHDLDFFLRLVVHDIKILIVEEELLYYRIHSTNTIKEDHLKVKKEWASITAMFIVAYFRTHPLENYFKFENDLGDILEKHGLLRYVLIYLHVFLQSESLNEYYDKNMLKINGSI